MKGVLVHLEAYSAYVRSGRRAMELEAGMLDVNCDREVCAHWKGR